MSSWLYGFKFLDRIRFNYCSVGFGEIRFLKYCDVNKFLIFANINKLVILWFYFWKKLTANIYKYKIYKEVKIIMTNIIYQNKESNTYGKREMNKLQH